GGQIALDDLTEDLARAIVELRQRDLRLADRNVLRHAVFAPFERSRNLSIRTPKCKSRPTGAACPAAAADRFKANGNGRTSHEGMAYGRTGRAHRLGAGNLEC